MTIQKKMKNKNKSKQKNKRKNKKIINYLQDKKFK